MTLWGYVKVQMAPEKQGLEKPEEGLQNNLLPVHVYHVSPLPQSSVCQGTLWRNTVATCHEQNYDFWSMENFWSNVPSEPSLEDSLTYVSFVPLSYGKRSFHYLRELNQRTSKGSVWSKRV